MKRTLTITGIIAVVAIIILIIFNKATSKKDVTNLYVQAKKGQFDIVVTTTGELQAENSTDIRGPEFSQLRNIRGMDIKIQDLVPEGTEVKTGDFIATLDKTAFDNTLKDELDKLTTYQTNMEMKTLDTAVTLSSLRDNIKNLTFTVEEAKITLQQSKYEPPTTIRQAEIALDKANRALDQSIKGYSLRVEQAKSDMRTNQKNFYDQQKRVSDLRELLSKFDIKAPSPGMVIYKRDRMGTKRKIGSTINPWDNVVATLPDMSSMISKTYVNEIDVSKVKPGQKVEIVVDAFPEKSYTGVVFSVANIGEQLPNADAKVFEVLIKVDGSDPILRPSMTTGNKIITKTISDVTYIPLESVQAGIDSIPFIYLKNGNKQVVILGESNENNVVVEQGVEAGTQLYLSTPQKSENFKLVGEELIPVIREKERLKKAEEKRVREEAEKTRAEREAVMGERFKMTPEMMQHSGGQRGQWQMRSGVKGGQGGSPKDSTAGTRRVIPQGKPNTQQRGNPSESAGRN
jgi:HlyD family secretion protein